MMNKSEARRQALVINGPRIDWGEKCRHCGHPRKNHSRAMGGCMFWDDEDYKGYCRCDGFRPASR